MSVAQINRLQAAHGKASGLLARLQRARDVALTAEGCESYDVYQGKDDPDQFVMVEGWTSVEAQQAHFEKNVKASGALESVMTLLSGPPEQAYFVLR
jgi:quinol monooxygenase YgiN